MSTICFKDGIMAADSRATGGASGIVSSKKLRTKKLGKKQILIGYVGWTAVGNLFVDWFGTDNKDMYDRLLRQDKDDFEALVWDGKTLNNWTTLLHPEEVDEAYYAIGSGAPYAIAAMDCGKTAAQAVTYAIKRDESSGGRIVTMSINKESK